MGILDGLRKYIRGEDYEDEEYEEFVQPDQQKKWTSYDNRQAPPVQERATDSRPARADSYSSDIRRNKVVNIHTVTQLSVVLVKPERYENAAEVADHLKDKRTVVLNLEQTNREIARRLLDFLSGVAYANEGKIKKVANSTYIITPYNVDIQGDLIDELENNGLYI